MSTAWRGPDRHREQAGWISGVYAGATLASGPVPAWAELRVALMAMSEMVLMVRRPMVGR
jgi:hypothetical protein